MDIESKIQRSVSLAPLTTFKIGGPAKFYVEVKSKEELSEAIEWAKENKEKFFILAGGSNVLVNDKGVDGLVMKMSNKNLQIKGERLDCGAGASLAMAASLATKENLTGLEWAVGIPGATIGGAVKGNAEAFDVAMSNNVETVEVFNIKKLKFEILSNRECEFSYRSSIFKGNKDYIIWTAILRLKKEKPEIIQKLIQQSIDFRNKKYPKLPSAGSVFKNIPVEVFKKENPLLFEKIMEEGKITRLDNIGAGLLIDQLGLKGKTIGGAKISLEHANHIVNTGKATAEDVIMLISFIKQQVRNRFKIQLQEEVQYLGF
jgi:UDP-N-acetylmuramate dehydrogenase